MARVSEKKLKREAQRQLDHQLVETVVALRTSSGGEKFLSELFTETEQVIFAKRLMMIFMLAQNISQYRISQTLNVSSSTVARIARILDQGGYQHIAGICRKKKNREMLWHELEIIVRLGMPSQGKDRWQWLDDLYT